MLCYRRKIEALGLGFHAVRPDCAWVEDPVAVRRLAHPRWGMLRALKEVLTSLRDSYDDTLAASEGADLLIGNLATYATGITAEKRRIPFVSAMHIPTLFFSGIDPPLVPGFPGLSRRLRRLVPRAYGPLGRSINWLARGLAGPWHRLRKDVALPRARGFNPLTDSRRTHTPSPRSFPRGSSLLTTLRSPVSSGARRQSSITVGSGLSERRCAPAVLP
jgi:rhamnosyltransferase subunit B